LSDKKKQVQKMFDSISGRYDFLNHFLSAGVDVYWRRKALKLTGLSPDSVLLDLACGTGDFSAEARRQGAVRIYGADLSFEMLKRFERKYNWINNRKVQSVGEQLPFFNNTFSNITVAFGVRNFYDLPAAFREFERVLVSSGKVTVLEFSLPKNRMVQSLYHFYFRQILPRIGRAISRHSDAYTYLPDSVEQFDKNVNLKSLFLSAGFREVQSHSLTFGLVQVLIAKKV
jgi:demethylmenaquinone methyltransferase/2-methoxy-6-polyprenyl-1,4-benzoquinol methylase